MFTGERGSMSDALRLVETGEKSRVVTFRIGESVYSALKQEAKASGEKVSTVARRLLLASMQGESGRFVLNVHAGDVLHSPTGAVVLLMKDTATEQEVAERVRKLMDVSLLKRALKRARNER